MKVELTKGELVLIGTALGCYQKEVNASVNDEQMKKLFPAAHKSVTDLKARLDNLSDKIFIYRTT